MLKPGIMLWFFFVLTAFGSDLVELAKVDFSIKQELRYATKNNFMKKAVYPTTARCLLRKPVAEALARAQNRLKLQGYGLKVYDCYRPLSVQKIMWEVMPDDRYVSDPQKGSKHNRGAAVDLTLVDSNGNEMEMPTRYDSFSKKAASDFVGVSSLQKKNRTLLQDALRAEGFLTIPTEWWHFDFKEWETYPIEDLPFTTIQ